MKFLPDKPPRICPWCSAASFATWPEGCRLLPSASRWTRALLPEPDQPAAFSPPWQRAHGRRRGRLSCSASATDFSSRTFHLCGVSADPLCLGPVPATLVPKTPFPATTSAVPRTRMSRCRTTRCCCCFPMMTSASLKRNTILGFEKSFLSSKQKNDLNQNVLSLDCKIHSDRPTEKQTTLGSSETKWCDKNSPKTKQNLPKKDAQEIH